MAFVSCRNYYCTEWDSDANGGHCLMANPKATDCQVYTVQNSTDELTKDELDFEYDDDFEVDLDLDELNPLPFKIDYGYQFPNCDDENRIISIIQDGLANGFRFEIKEGRIIVKENC